MAVVFVEGFDAYNGAGNTLTAPGLLSRWTVNGSGNPSLVPGRFGGQAFQAATGSFDGILGSPIPTTSNSGAFGCAMYLTSAGTKGLITFATGFAVNSRQFCLATNNGYFVIGTGSSSSAYPDTVVYTCPVLVPLSQWFYLEIEFVISNTVGEIRMYYNGALVGSATGLDTQTSATTSSWGYLQLGTDTLAGTRWFDDLYITDTPVRLGEQRVATVVPVSDGTPSQWAASGGAVAPYTMVDEVLCNGDTDYIYDGTLGDRAVFNMASTGATPVSVSAVQIGTFSRKTDTGYRAIQLQYVDGGGTAYSSSDITLGTAYNRQVNLLGTNPATSTAWTPSEANALKTGVRISV